MLNWILWVGAAFAGDPEPLIKAIDLPIAANHLREAGVPDKDVADAIKAHKDAGVPASEADDAIVEAEKDVKEHGPVDNFGAFVQARLAEGKRGSELAAAIKAEHAARGKGHGKPDGEHGKPDGEHGKPDGEHGKPEEPGSPGTRGKPDEAGGPGERGKPADGGKPGERGKPETEHGKPAEPGKGAK